MNEKKETGRGKERTSERERKGEKKLREKKANVFRNDFNVNLFV